MNVSSVHGTDETKEKRYFWP